MLATPELRGAVTSSELLFSPALTALSSCVYAAAALTGFLCAVRVRARYFAHLLAVALDSVAVAGRGSFIVACMLTLLGLAITWRGEMRRGITRLAATTALAGAAVVALSLVVGRSDVLENIWQYVTAPLFGLPTYLALRPDAGVAGPLSLNALLSKFGADRYDAGAFVWFFPFTANVHSGYRELFSDVGLPGLLLFAPLAMAGLREHVRYRESGAWGPYAIALSLYSYLAYFYYISLSAFLTAWWAILLSGLAAFLLDIIRRKADERSLFAQTRR